MGGVRPLEEHLLWCHCGFVRRSTSSFTTAPCSQRLRPSSLIRAFSAYREVSYTQSGGHPKDGLFLALGAPTQSAQSMSGSTTLKPGAILAWKIIAEGCRTTGPGRLWKALRRPHARREWLRTDRSSLREPRAWPHQRDPLLEGSGRGGWNERTAACHEARSANDTSQR
jgi:hypothetical protein